MSKSKLTAIVGMLFCLGVAFLPAEEIHDAVRAGDLARVKALVEMNPDLVKARNPAGETPLFDAVRKKLPEIMGYLISKGADVNAWNGFHMTPLHLACRNGLPIEGIRFLVDKGADVNAVAKYQGKPLDLATDGGFAEVAAFLASKGASPSPAEFATFRLGEGLQRIAFPWGMRNNLVVSAGPDGALVVDSGFSPRVLDEIRKIIKGFGGAEIRYVVNTHTNWDHVAGNALAPSQEAVVDLNKLKAGAHQNLITKSEAPLSGRSGRTLPAPYLFRFNGQDIRLIPYPGLHSEDDILIHFTKSGVLCMGDLLLSQNCPAVGNVAGYLELLDNVLDVFPEETIFVSGHGRDLTFDGLKAYRNALGEMNAAIRRNFEAGRSAEDMIKDDVLKAYKADYTFLDWLGPDFWIQRVVESLRTGRLK